MGTVGKIKKKHFSTYMLVVRTKRIANPMFLRKRGFAIRGNTASKELRSDDELDIALMLLKKAGAEITGIETKKPSLEDYFVKMVKR